MRAAIYDEFHAPIEIRTVPDPTPDSDGVVVEVHATGVCRSDWHGWMGHDEDITLPHVPGHELAGIVVETGRDVSNFHPGDRVTVPFVCGCGACGLCDSGNHQVCPDQHQPGFTHWGSFAGLVALRYADTNLVSLPEDLDFVTAASLGCRFSTSFRAVAHRARIGPSEWLAVHGCGGVGLSAVMIGHALGARVLAVDIDDGILDLARSCGAAATLRADQVDDVGAAVIDVTDGGAHASIDALGATATCRASIAGLRRQGRHVQIGLLVGDESHQSLPMDRVIGHELELLGSHGMSATDYPEMLQMIRAGSLDPARLVTRETGLEEGVAILAQMGERSDPGITVITNFDG